ncbi:hypothetical protein IJF85_00775 [Candidatus Saccharibacteria bacterium]|nr:hypothetical protein [Candidatus Saccharibacteria bacterium]MBQ3263915.1 hypothetical protein [Candidatus Saccharibacteria bacterium]
MIPKPESMISETGSMIFWTISYVSTSYPFLKHKPDLAVVIVTEITVHSRLLSAK